MISYVSYRTPIIRSSVGRSFIPRSDSRGDRAGFSADDPPVVTELVHTPGYWNAYGAQTIAVGIAVVLGLFGILMGLTVSDHDKAHGFATFMVLPSVLMIIIGLVLLALFYNRYQRMTKVFEDALAEAPAPATTEPAADTSHLAAEHPNAGRYVHGSWIGGILAIIISLSFVELIAGFVLVFYADSMRSSEGVRMDLFSVALLVQGVANLGLAYAIKQHRMRALGWVILLSVLSLAAAVATLQWYLILYAAVTCILFWLAGRSLSKVDADIASADKSDPLQVYYHNLLQLLVHVMRADGHCDRRELSKITRLCDNMNLSDYERDLVIESTNDHPLEPLSDVIPRYRMAADLAHIPDPAQSLIVAAVAVAAADGVLASEERAAIEDMAKHLDVDATLYEAALAAHAPPDQMSEDLARTLLNVTADTDATELDSAYQTLRAELNAAHFAHLGHRLAKTLNERLILVDEAYDLLHRKAPAPGID